MRKTIVQLTLLGLLAAACSAGPKLGTQVISNNTVTQTFESGPTQTHGCDQVTYTVQPGDTLAYIAAAYDVHIEAIRAYNNLGSDSVTEGQYLIIPLCERIGPVYLDPTVTPIFVWDYPAPVPLLPADSSFYYGNSQSLMFLWESVGTLGIDEAYRLEIRGFLTGSPVSITVFLTGTEYILAPSAIACSGLLDSFSWWVTPVRRDIDEATGATTWFPIGEESRRQQFDRQCTRATLAP